MLTYSLSVVNERNGKCLTVHIEDEEQRKEIAQALMSGKDFHVGVDPRRSIEGAGHYPELDDDEDEF